MASVYKKAGIEAARIAGLHPEMDVAANLLRRTIVAEAARHSDTGAFADSFSVATDLYEKKGVQDRVVSSDDPAALSIEYGHATPRREGRQLRKFVPGLMIVNEAVNKLR